MMAQSMKSSSLPDAEATEQRGSDISRMDRLHPYSLEIA
jgi:hypothetical protein